MAKTEKEMNQATARGDFKSVKGKRTAPLPALSLPHPITEMFMEKRFMLMISVYGVLFERWQCHINCYFFDFQFNFCLHTAVCFT